ncbi:endonuclease/exonuclease/phosphatase family protein [Halorarum salinum]|uniref:Endonuclease/exonuclease/phosphatase family protein n=2 Tax=Halorarum salinum TaxID=2743089 RepID=A0A7D5QN98_9EURY|nr:endonuclease/exonuclease/phosphatase family protein [Halobaculum salinum]
MTYNVRYANPNDGENVWPNRRDHVATAIRFHKPDLVGLQEAVHGQLEDLRTRLPDFEWLAAGRPAEGTAGEYVPIGYRRNRFEPADDGSFWLSETPDAPGRGWDAALPRLVHYVRFRDRATGVAFRHFNTHFDHRGGTARRRSAELLRDRVDELASDDPIVVTGDFNSRESTEPYRVLTEEGGHRRSLTDTHRISKHPHHGPSTSMTDFGNLIPQKKIDHVLVSPGAEVINHGSCSDTYGDGRYPSDHLPVVADVSLPDRR